MGAARRIKKVLKKVVRQGRRAAQGVASAAHRLGLKGRPQSGAIPYRFEGRHLQVLLVTGKRGGWVIPKGNIEPDLTSRESAAKEAEEEAGVLGAVGAAPVGTFRYRKDGRLHVVEVFDLAVGRVLERWDEAHLRRREWLDVDAAAARVRSRDLAKFIRDLPGRVARVPAGGPRGGARRTRPRTDPR